uniref:Uncharacterized protein n=1 Tax=Romanomermis culicivorax TaxID=13658 RepID=A0A915L7Z0_ROMCU
MQIDQYNGRRTEDGLVSIFSNLDTLLIGVLLLLLVLLVSRLLIFVGELEADSHPTQIPFDTTFSNWRNIFHRTFGVRFLGMEGALKNGLVRAGLDETMRRSVRHLLLALKLLVGHLSDSYVEKRRRMLEFCHHKRSPK